MDAAVRTINGWRKGTPGTNNNKDFKTFAARNMVRILTMTAGLLENTENKADATDVIKVLKSAAELIGNLKPAGREKQETKIKKASGTDTWTKKPPRTRTQAT